MNLGHARAGPLMPNGWTLSRQQSYRLKDRGCCGANSSAGAPFALPSQSFGKIIRFRAKPATHSSTAAAEALRLLDLHDNGEGLRYFDRRGPKPKTGCAQSEQRACPITRPMYFGDIHLTTALVVPRLKVVEGTDQGHTVVVGRPQATHWS